MNWIANFKNVQRNDKFKAKNFKNKSNRPHNVLQFLEFKRPKTTTTTSATKTTHASQDIVTLSVLSKTQIDLKPKQIQIKRLNFNKKTKYLEALKKTDLNKKLCKEEQEENLASQLKKYLININVNKSDTEHSDASVPPPRSPTQPQQQKCNYDASDDFNLISNQMNPSYHPSSTRQFDFDFDFPNANFENSFSNNFQVPNEYDDYLNTKPASDFHFHYSIDSNVTGGFTREQFNHFTNENMSNTSDLMFLYKNYRLRGDDHMYDFNDFQRFNEFNSSIDYF